MDDLTVSERKVFTMLARPGTPPTVHMIFARLFSTDAGRKLARKLSKSPDFGLREKQQRVGSYITRINKKLSTTHRIEPTGTGRYKLIKLPKKRKATPKAK